MMQMAASACLITAVTLHLFHIYGRMIFVSDVAAVVLASLLAALLAASQFYDRQLNNVVRPTEITTVMFFNFFNAPLIRPLFNAILALHALPPLRVIQFDQLCRDGYYMIAAAFFGAATAMV